MEQAIGQINYLAVVAAAVAAFVLGGLWYSLLFGKAWMERRPAKLLLINGGYHTLQYTLYGAILGLWH